MMSQKVGKTMVSKEGLPEIAPPIKVRNKKEQRRFANRSYGAAVTKSNPNPARSGGRWTFC
jgi:hypothetical protein